MATAKKIAANKRAYMRKVAEGRCTNCGKIDDRTLAGHARCEACNIKAHAGKAPKQRTEEQRLQDIENKREWYHMRKNAHVCVQCGRQDKRTLSGMSTCLFCATRRNKNARENRDKARDRETDAARKARWIAAGLCSTCGGEKEEPERAMCINCRVKSRLRYERNKYKNGWKPPRGANGMCWQCNSAPVVNGKKLCPDCYAVKLRSIAIATAAANAKRNQSEAGGVKT